jgi:hypothetical protein
MIKRKSSNKPIAKRPAWHIGPPPRPGDDLGVEAIGEAMSHAAKEAIKHARDEMAKEIQAAVLRERENQRAVRVAENRVRPWVGLLSQSFDSPEEVYGETLKMLGVDHKRYHPALYRYVLELQPLPGGLRLRGPDLDRQIKFLASTWRRCRPRRRKRSNDC